MVQELQEVHAVKISDGTMSSERPPQRVDPKLRVPETAEGLKHVCSEFLSLSDPEVFLNA